MAQTRVSAFSLSIDGFAAGAEQTLSQPLGIGGEDLHAWMHGTRMFQRMLGKDGGSEGTDDDYAQRSMDGIGAWIMGRNMFGPVRGPWPDDDWKGWWGDDPPYHVPVFVLTHHARAPLQMDGGTTFHFVTGGIREAHERAREAAGGRDVRIGGGAETIRQFLRAGLVDRMHLAISPIVLGRGERPFDGIDLAAAGFRCIERAGTPDALHVVLEKEAA